LLEQKVTKIQGFRKIRCDSNQEVSSRNTRHERFEQRIAFVVAVYCYAHAIHTYLLQEPLTYFSEASPYKQALLLGKHSEQGLAIFDKISCPQNELPIVRNNIYFCSL
jgi:hypothetical protein